MFGVTAAEPKLANILFIMRHGRTVLDSEHRSDGWLDYPLSDDGRVGLMPVQQYLKSAPITQVHTSTLRRCAETAHIIASGILSKPKMHTDDDMRTWNLGELVGGKKKSNKPVVMYYMEHPEQEPKSGESLDAFRSRFMPCILKCMTQVVRGKGPFLLVTSGSGIREISYILSGNRDMLDLDEAGLAMLFMHAGKVHGKVIFGHKDEDGEWLS